MNYARLAKYFDKNLLRRGFGCLRYKVDADYSTPTSVRILIRSLFENVLYIITTILFIAGLEPHIVSDTHQVFRMFVTHLSIFIHILASGVYCCVFEHYVTTSTTKHEKPNHPVKGRAFCYCRRLRHSD